VPTLEEMTAWTVDELRTEIAALLPDEWRFRSGWDGNLTRWAAFIERLEDEKWAVVWHGESPDERLLLFNAFGNLWLERQPKPASGSPWDPFRQTRRGPMRVPTSSGVPDPEDLDPAEVAAVYESVRDKK
jgi:hypothetical protein